MFGFGVTRAMPEWFYLYQDYLAQLEEAEHHIHFKKKRKLDSEYLHGMMPVPPMFNKNAIIKNITPEEHLEIIKSIELEDHYLSMGCRPHPNSYMCTQHHYHPITGKFRYSCKQRCCGKSLVDCKCPIETMDRD